MRMGSSMQGFYPLQGRGSTKGRCARRGFGYSYLVRLDLLAGVLLVSFLGGCAGSVTFPNVTPGKPVEVKGQLYRPEGPGPFPAMVLLHGCSGVEPLYERWAKWLTERGYVAFVVDSWTPRGIIENCSKGTPDVENTDRFDDAFGALRYLQSRPFVRPGRIGAIGWSNGGVFAIAVVNGPSLERARKRGVTLPAVGFRLGIGMYPGGCFSLVKEVVVAPLLVLIGAADDWTLAATCKEMVDAMRAKGADAEIRILPDAYHYFDNADYPLQVLPDVENRNKPGDCCGATVGYQPEAAAAAFAEVERFLAKHLK
jgi:dienelactone hydrolase